MMRGLITLICTHVHACVHVRPGGQPWQWFSCFMMVKLYHMVKPFNTQSAGSILVVWLWWYLLCWLGENISVISRIDSNNFHKTKYLTRTIALTDGGANVRCVTVLAIPQSVTVVVVVPTISSLITFHGRESDGGGISSLCWLGHGRVVQRTTNPDNSMGLRER